MVTGYANGTNFYVNDPNHDIPTYSWEEMADLIVYRIKNAGNPVIPTQYPLFTQCDPRWGNDTMVGQSVLSVASVAYCSIWVCEGQRGLETERR